MIKIILTESHKNYYIEMHFYGYFVEFAFWQMMNYNIFYDLCREVQSVKRKHSENTASGRPFRLAAALLTAALAASLFAGCGSGGRTGRRTSTGR